MQMKDFISNIFGKSPVAPLQDHIQICHDCAKCLIDLFEAVVAEDDTRVHEIREMIVNMEDQADELKSSIRTSLTRSLFMPVARQDLLELILVQDKIANRARDISGLVVGRRMKIPAPLNALFIEYVRKSVKAVKQAKKSINELDELYETSFRGAEVELVSDMIHKIDTIETESDALQQQLRNELYQIEQDYPPIDIMFLYQVIGLIGEVGDMAERTGRRLELMVSN